MVFTCSPSLSALIVSRRALMSLSLQPANISSLQMTIPNWKKFFSFLCKSEKKEKVNNVDREDIFPSIFHLPLYPVTILPFLVIKS